MIDHDLTAAQSAALRHIEDYASKLRSVGQIELPNVLKMSNVSPKIFEAAQRQIKQYARILIADPSFKGRPIEDGFKTLCADHALELRWHCGFRLPVNAVPDDFRGPAMPSLAKRIAPNGWVDARTIGAAAADLHANPARWADRGSPAAVLQELKCLWHVLVQFGAAAA